MNELSNNLYPIAKRPLFADSIASKKIIVRDIRIILKKNMPR
ncbi:MAG TPA: hypothetical protein VL325_09320 [Pyrinomonadaceae bacterium]|nr:hypothetical protein [Pyrinomonadaceae bacterium]